MKHAHGRCHACNLEGDCSCYAFVSLAMRVCNNQNSGGPEYHEAREYVGLGAM